MSNEWIRLAQNNHTGVESTDIIGFINHCSVPTDRKVTYTSVVYDHRQLKYEKRRIRLVVGGDILTYDADSGSPVTDLLETKILFSSVISDAKDGVIF